MDRSERGGTYDLLIRGGRVIDPINSTDTIADVLVHRGLVVAVLTSSESIKATRTIEAHGKIVTPGLIDLHVHCFSGLSSYGVDADRIGIHSGCTHVNDMGSTGCFTVGAFREWIADKATTGVTCFPNMLGFGVPENWGVSNTGLGAESVSATETIGQAKGNPSLIRGVKVHCEPGEISWWGHKTFDAAVEVAEECGLPIYAHLGYLFPEKPGVPRTDPDTMLVEAIGRLRPGDIIGHAFSGHLGSLIDSNGKLHPRAKELPDRGLLLEVGYGLTSTYAASRTLLEAGLLPDIISSDAHGITLGRPRKTLDFGDLCYTMVGTMTKYWALGVPLSKVIEASTATPARVLGLERTRGALTAGMAADITILDPREGLWELTDNAGERIRTERALIPTHTIKDGHVHDLEVMARSEFRAEYVTAGVRAKGLHPVRSLGHCTRIVSGNWWKTDDKKSVKTV